FERSWLFFFFFQAEDGIRDFHVTGVQTCALPIFSSTSDVFDVPCSRSARGLAPSGLLLSLANSHSLLFNAVVQPRARQPSNPPRSEERRVGKECRSRWPPSHEKTQVQMSPHLPAE